MGVRTACFAGGPPGRRADDGRTSLHRYRDGSWMTISTEDGLPDGAAVAVTEDRAGGLWVTTTAGLRRYHPDADPDARPR